ncbi:MAG: radical SAM protein [Candidatus Sungbacteria bacterium]|nr:radical SAM protein [bacterium]MDZ4260281.1 radical SAM protein [Candidatus Sungbacteria bacterium]
MAVESLHIVFIKPSKYDDDGYVICFGWGVLPSNTLHVLNGLTQDIKERKVLGPIDITTSAYDETVQFVPVEDIIAESKKTDTMTLICLAGVQTNQFPRAMDLAQQFRSAGLPVFVGGFHTSGTINMLSDQEPEIQDMVKRGITVISGEAEGNWEHILQAALDKKLEPIYSFATDLKNLPDISTSPFPMIHPDIMKHYVLSTMGTIDTSRGCPFDCSFCTIINVQGRTMRARSPEHFKRFIRDNYLNHGINQYFITDDNFKRNPQWREILDSLCDLRSREGISIQFVAQVDMAKSAGDFEKRMAEAGCTQVFIGLESVNPENLKAESKVQNKVEQFKEIINKWHQHNILVHAGYIIGLPFDTKDQVNRDVQYLSDVLELDTVSFFMLTPLPGSHDHLQMKKKDVWMDPDFNNRDSFHATVTHPLMTSQDWTASYHDAWRVFYSKENIARRLARVRHNPVVYKRQLWMSIWYKNASLIEHQHPMIAGFLRLKDRTTRRPGFPINSPLIHFAKRSRDILTLSIRWIQFARELHAIWKATKPDGEKKGFLRYFLSLTS